MCWKISCYLRIYLAVSGANLNLSVRVFGNRALATVCKTTRKWVEGQHGPPGFHVGRPYGKLARPKPSLYACCQPFSKWPQARSIGG